MKSMFCVLNGHFTAEVRGTGTLQPVGLRADENSKKQTFLENLALSSLRFVSFGLKVLKAALTCDDQTTQSSFQITLV